MLPDWHDIAYLLGGNARQRAAHDLLARLGIFDSLAPHRPTLVGTIPIDVDLPESDLDIICEAASPDAFAEIVRAAYGDRPDFQQRFAEHQGMRSAVARFTFEETPIEVFAQDRPISLQNAFRHMVVEARLLALAGPEANEAIRALKRSGLKTEPAFARYFAIPGDAYAALSRLYDAGDDVLRQIAAQAGRI